ncbi:uncharacterized protein LOC123879288 isoform X2 [Maniola jurtina]|uniref:uncharacterized protein LOC123879288 isoform X2 n=1 Tax=Maniola jurtina TaxID=191418 RepID=UPI001E68FD42|nr:uncharacterized protein LOC123879288 isoform X2 [Maniola jurtina]
MCSTEGICEEKSLDDSGFVPMSCADLSAQDVSMSGRHVYLLDLSDDVLLYILKYCKARDLKAVGYTCSRLARLVLERSLWRYVEGRSDACSKARLKWLIENALHKDTQVLKLSGYARDSDGCMGFVNMTRKEAEQETKNSCDEENIHGHNALEKAISANVSRMLGERHPTHPARLFISAQRSQFHRQRCFPIWPDDEEEGRSGPQHCSGPQFTLSQALLLNLSTTCPQLTTLELDYCNIDCSSTSLAAFPRTLKRLSLRGSKCYNMTYDKSFLFRIQDYMPLLESVDVSECEWLDPASLLPISKLTALEELLMRDCCKLTEFVAYASLTARYGFRALKSLDLRGSPVGDSEVQALGWLPKLEKLWLSARRTKRAEPHAHYTDDERTPHVQLHEWETHEPDCFKQKPSPDMSMEDVESGMGEPIPSTHINPDTNYERSQLKDTNGNNNKDKKGTKRKPDKGTGERDDTDDNGEPSCKRIRTDVKVTIESTSSDTGRPVADNERDVCIFDEINKAFSPLEEEFTVDNVQPNPTGNVGIKDVEIDFRVINVDGLRNPRNSDENNRDIGNNSNRNIKKIDERTVVEAINQAANFRIKEMNERYFGRRNNENQTNDRPNNERDERSLVDSIKIDQEIEINCDRENNVILIASSSRSKNEPSTSKQSDDSQKTPNNKKPTDSKKQNDDKKPVSLGYIHFRRNQRPVYVNMNREGSGEENQNRNDENSDASRQESVSDDFEKGESENKMDDAKPGPSKEPVNDGASTSKDGQNGNKANNKRFPIFVPHNCAPENVQRREPLPPVQYHIEPRHHVLYVGVGPQINTFRFPRDSSELLQHLNLSRIHVDSSGLVTDFSMRRFGRAEGEDVNVIHIGPDGPMAAGQATGSRPDRSSLRFLSVTGYRNITDRSLVHLATAAPNLSFIDFSGTSVTENGAENFRSLRPDCDIVFSQFHENKENESN